MRYFFFLGTFFLIISCTRHQTLDVDAFLDNWHMAASKASYSDYFSKLDGDAIYLGTQWDERWNKKEFSDFAKPYFDRGRAWDFKPINRTCSFSTDKKLVWFDETLETWMGVCRGSGVIRNYDDSLKIVQYNLSVTISNDLVHEFVDLIKKDSINSFLLDE